MSGRFATRRGQPLLALGLVIVCWVTGRAMTWDGRGVDGLPAALPGRPMALPQHWAATKPAASRPRSSAGQISPRYVSGEAPQGLQSPPEYFALAATGPWEVQQQIANTASLPAQRLPAKTAQTDPQEFYEPPVAKDDPRWSGENWLLMRAGSGSAAQAPGAASYGASQAGAIVRYRFGKGAPEDSYAYLRTSLAINAPGKDKEVALGLGLRPVRRVPLRVLAEARLQDTSRSPMQVRPVATVITEIPWQRLPHGFRLEAYGQAGYAGGRNATAFFDAQALVDHPVRGMVSRNGDLRAGVGLWSGGQRDAVRLDVGPRVSFRLEGGRLFGPTRVALDWRLRVAGNARPGSGPTMTVSSAF
ncbi:MAG: hypothetical protein ACO1OX_14645 [Novosphingobium sp.]